MMFERFTHGARDAVRAAVDAADGGDTLAGEEHLLRALLDAEATRGAAVLRALGVTARRAEVERSLTEARRRGGVSKADAEALAGIGIDVAEVLGRLEAAHGEGALARTVPKRRWGSRLDDDAKHALQKALREALARGDKEIGDEHLLLALAARPGPVADALAENGATYAAVTRALND
jgi:ATP-dependent Clp protease ATP-binding subunit ClpA